MAQENDAGGAAGVKKLLALGAFGASIGPSCDALHNQVVVQPRPSRQAWRMALI